MSKLFKEFKEFVMRGNVLDMAVGVIIGGAFGKIVTSLVNDILMPPLGFAIGQVDFTKLSIKLSECVTINYGKFIQEVVEFLIIAFCIFILVKVINSIAKDNKKKENMTQPLQPSLQEKLLAEIRDLLKEKCGGNL